jgi:hypothetical protein
VTAALKVRSRARLLNSDHELIAEGLCELDERAGQASLEVDRTTGVVQKQRGHLSLELDSGRSLLVTDKPIMLTITPPGKKPTQENRRKIFRLRLVDPMAALKEQEAGNKEQGEHAAPSMGGDAAAKGTGPDAALNIAQDASAVGAAGEGRPAASHTGRLSAEGRGETPAAR